MKRKLIIALLIALPFVMNTQPATFMLAVDENGNLVEDADEIKITVIVSKTVKCGDKISFPFRDSIDTRMP